MRQHIGRFFRADHVATLVVTGMIFAALATPAHSDVTIRTVPEQDVVVADGQTEYRMDVVGNTTGELTKQIRSVDWQVYIPDKITFKSANIPQPTEIDPVSGGRIGKNPNDFFFDESKL